LIGILILVVLIIVGISYGWATMDQLEYGYDLFMQVIQSEQFKEEVAKGSELLK